MLTIFLCRIELHEPAPKLVFSYVRGFLFVRNFEAKAEAE